MDGWMEGGRGGRARGEKEGGRREGEREGREREKGRREGGREGRETGGGGKESEKGEREEEREIYMAISIRISECTGMDIGLHESQLGTYDACQARVLSAVWKQE